MTQSAIRDYLKAEAYKTEESSNAKPATDKQINYLAMLMWNKGTDYMSEIPYDSGLTSLEASRLIGYLLKEPDLTFDQIQARTRADDAADPEAANRANLRAGAKAAQKDENRFEDTIDRPISTGFAKLDEIYTVMPSTFCLVTGISNHGKSNFVDQIAVNMMKNHGWKFAIFSPDHSSADHIRRLTEKVVRKPFHAFGGARMTRVELTEAMHTLQDHFYFVKSRDNLPDIDWLLSKFKVARLRHRVDGIIIDPYHQIAMNLKSDAREDQHIRDLISKCKSFCRDYRVAMWMVANPTKLRKDDAGVYQPPSLYDVAGTAHWFNMCDVGLVVHRDFEGTEVQIITRKIRERGLYGEIGKRVFNYDKKACSYVPIDL